MKKLFYLTGKAFFWLEIKFNNCIVGYYGKRIVSYEKCLEICKKELALYKEHLIEAENSFNNFKEECK
ncbi:hypothetical protein M0R19_06320 [Candidatus Pacearchaeota archaeon]|jgi:hypothetical protein|nr:hypothetical protein [Candidatus Pacearchaeota archaeon]